jgi:uncharacterized protein YnzC (UPF0291/DUF896 family)
MSHHPTNPDDLEAAILSRVINPNASTLSAEAARSILVLGFPEADMARMNTLAAKARNGQLTAAEDDELESYLRIGRFLALIQTKARHSLQHYAGIPA